MRGLASVLTGAALVGLTTLAAAECGPHAPVAAEPKPAVTATPKPVPSSPPPTAETARPELTTSQMPTQPSRL